MFRNLIPWSFLLAVIPAITTSNDAHACGGCFTQTQSNESTQVTGHRMIFSISNVQTTLWDQIEYSGDPESFAWVLPIAGTVDVGVSSDALFQVLQQTTQVTIIAPTVTCNSQGGGTGGGDGAVVGAGGGNGGGGVTVLENAVVGPYETVQLSAQDPNALNDWLALHGYNLPAAVQPVVASYVAEGSNFLAMKLVPGQGVSSMKPIRITSQGAGVTLPLRMVAAGAGAFMPIQLWVFGEGRYQAQNFPGFVINPNDVFWYWDSAISNYTSLVKKGFADSNGYAWLTDFARPIAPSAISSPIESQALDQYADENGMNAQANFDADMLALYGNLTMNSVWLTHLVAKLPQEALATDLILEASPNQAQVLSTFYAELHPGSNPCGDNNGSGGWSGVGSGGNSGGSGASSAVPGGKGSCDCRTAAESSPIQSTHFAAGLIASLALFFRRRRRAAE